MNVLVFDIDGTLTMTNRVDAEFFKSAIQAALPAVVLESFDHFTEMTDTAILQDICSEQGIRDYQSVESRVQAHFVDGLIRAVSEQAASFSAVRGATTIFSAVRDAGWVPAIATGGWRPSAELKLDAAKIPTAGVPLATSSEARHRVDIIRGAVSAATADSETSSVIYVGDGSWDIAACRELEIGFIGRAEGEQVDRLEGLGARAVVPDFSDTAAFRQLLSRPADLTLSVDEV